MILTFVVVALMAPVAHGLFFGGLTCSVDFMALLQLTISAACEGDTPSLGLYPEVYANLNLLSFLTGGSFFEGGLCFYPDIGTDPVYPVGLCIDFNTANILPPLTGDEITADEWGPAADATFCTARVGDDTCKSCDVCADGTSIKFDCSEINPDYVASNCTDLGLVPSQLFDVFQANEVGVPTLDG